MKVIQAQSITEIATARKLFQEYAAALSFSLCFQNFDQEVSSLPGKYAPPAGRLLLAVQDEDVAGCIALRPLDVDACEMKRLYVRPQFRGQGFGQKLVAAVIGAAREIGYERMRLDTVPGKMDRAIALYRSIGFHEIPPYYDNPFDDVLFMELRLAQAADGRNQETP